MSQQWCHKLHLVTPRRFQVRCSKVPCSQYPSLYRTYSRLTARLANCSQKPLRSNHLFSRFTLLACDPSTSCLTLIRSFSASVEVCLLLCCSAQRSRRYCGHEHQHNRNWESPGASVLFLDRTICYGILGNLSQQVRHNNPQQHPKTIFGSSQPYARSHNPHHNGVPYCPLRVLLGIDFLDT